MGECQGPVQVQVNGFCASHCRAQEQQLPHEVGRLNNNSKGPSSDPSPSTGGGRGRGRLTHHQPHPLPLRSAIFQLSLTRLFALVVSVVFSLFLQCRSNGGRRLCFLQCTDHVLVRT